MMKTILLDLDGTLIDTTGIIIDTFKVTFEKYLSHIKMSDKDYTNLLGQTLWQTFEYYESDENKVNDMVEFYRKTSNDMIESGLNAYPGALDALKYLRKKGATIGVVTSKMRKVALYHLELTGLKDYIDGLIGYEDVENHKPDPEPILKALELFNANKETTVYVGDHENDMVAAKKAGIYTCAVTYSQRLEEMLKEQPHFVIDELAHLKDFI